LERQFSFEIHLKTFAVVLEAARPLAVASLVVSPFIASLSLANFWFKGGWISLQTGSDCASSIIFVF